MIETIVTNIIAVLFALIASYTKKPEKGLFVSFMIVFIFLALRYNFGNDYNEYHEYFDYVHRVAKKDLLSFDSYGITGLKEVGYTFLNRWFSSFYLLVALLSLLSCYTYFKIIKDYSIHNLIWFSVFIFLFDASLMLVQSSSMRQTVGICLFVLSIKPLCDKNLIKYSLLIFLGSLFHFSIIILWPVYFLATQKHWNKMILIVLLASYFILTFAGYLVFPLIEGTVINYFPRYKEAYMDEIVGNDLNTSLGYIFWSAVFILILWAHNKVQGPQIVISKLTLIAFTLSPIGIYLSMFNRILMYFNPFIILTLPIAIYQLKSHDIRMIVIFILVIWYLLNFYLFFQDPVWKDQFGHYQINLIHGR